MRKRLLKTLVFLILTLVLIVGVWVILDKKGTETKQLIVGCPIPRASAYGQNGERGLILATEEINVTGGININDKHKPLKLEIVDTRDLEPGVPTSEVLLAIEKLILQKKADFIVGGPCMSEAGIAAMDLYARYKVVDIVSIGCYTPTWNEKKFASNPKKYRYSFRESGSVAWYIKEGVDLLHHIKEKFGFNKIFIMIEDSLMCRKAAEMAESLAVKDGWQIVGRDRHPIAATDFSVALSECKQSGSQVLFIWAYAPETSILLRQWADMKVPALPLGFIGAAEDPGFWDATKGKCAYTVVALAEAGNVPSRVTPRTLTFYDNFKKKWGVPPRSTGCVSAYESLYVLKDALERAGTLEKEAIITALEHTNLPSVRGTVRFNQNHQIIYGYDPKESVLGTWIQWQDGQRMAIWPPAASVGEIKIPSWVEGAP